MKTWSIVWRVLAVLAAIAGVVFVIVKYGDKICAWVKGICAKLGCCCNTPTDIVEAEEAPEAEAVPEETVQAEETDFEG